jgi:hypothetical protein
LFTIGGWTHDALPYTNKHFKKDPDSDDCPEQYYYPGHTCENAMKNKTTLGTTWKERFRKKTVKKAIQLEAEFGFGKHTPISNLVNN